MPDDDTRPSGADVPEEATRARRLDFPTAEPLPEEPRTDDRPRARRLDFPAAEPPKEEPPKENLPRARKLDLPSADSSQEEPRAGGPPRARRLFPDSIPAPEPSVPVRVSSPTFDLPSPVVVPAEASGPRLLFGGSAHEAFPITEELLRSIDANTATQDNLLRSAIAIVRSFSVTDPPSRYAIYGSDLQQDYGRLLEDALKLGEDSDLRSAKEGLHRLLNAVESIDFTSLVAPQGGFFGLFRQTVDIAVFRTSFGTAHQMVKVEQEGLRASVHALEIVKSRIDVLEQRRKALVEAIRAHVLAGRGVLLHLADERKHNLLARILSLETTALTVKNERYGELLSQAVEGLIANIRDTILTWVPVWLSTANDTFALMEHGRIRECADMYRRLMEARSTILTLKGN